MKRSLPIVIPGALFFLVLAVVVVVSSFYTPGGEMDHYVTSAAHTFCFCLWLVVPCLLYFLGFGAMCAFLPVSTRYVWLDITAAGTSGIYVWIMVRDVAASFDYSLSILILFMGAPGFLGVIFGLSYASVRKIVFWTDETRKRMMSVKAKEITPDNFS